MGSKNLKRQKNLFNYVFHSAQSYFLTPLVDKEPYFLKKVAIKFLRKEKEEKSFSFEVLSKKTGINNNYKEAKELIIKSLEAENPVAILINHRVSDKILKKNFKYHWITITGIRTEDKKTYLTASNWGEKWEYLNFEEIWNDSHNVLDRIFASGLVVMKEQEKPKQSLKSINSVALLCSLRLTKCVKNVTL